MPHPSVSVPARRAQLLTPHSTAPRNGAQAAAAAAVPPAPPRSGRRVHAAACVRHRRREHGHGYARPPSQARQAAQQHAARRRAPAWRPRRRGRRARHRHGVVQPVPGQLGLRRHAADVRHGGVPLRGAGVRLPEVRPPRQVVPQVPVAPDLLRAPEVLTARPSTIYKCLDEWNLCAPS